MKDCVNAECWMETDSLTLALMSSDGEQPAAEGAWALTHSRLLQATRAHFH